MKTWKTVTLLTHKSQ